jgi:hypothetical protein
MHEGQPYGHLTVFGRKMDEQALARLIGESTTAVRKWLKELGDNEVYSVTDDGLIFSRRMVRDEEIREKRAAGGDAGAGHGKKGAKYGSLGGRPRKTETPQHMNGTGVKKPPLEPPPSSSTSSSGSNEPIASTNVDVSAGPTDTPPDYEPPVTVQEIVDAWNDRMVRQGFPRVERVTGTRLKYLKARIRENTVADFQRAMDALERSSFCRGENRDGWRADFDFFVQSKSFTKLLEGSFDH